jgi:hypothetical protein
MNTSQRFAVHKTFQPFNTGQTHELPVISSWGAFADGVVPYVEERCIPGRR